MTQTFGFELVSFCLPVVSSYHRVSMFFAPTDLPVVEKTNDHSECV